MPSQPGDREQTTTTCNNYSTNGASHRSLTQTQHHSLHPTRCQLQGCTFPQGTALRTYLPAPDPCQSRPSPHSGSHPYQGVLHQQGFMRPPPRVAHTRLMRSKPAPSNSLLCLSQPYCLRQPRWNPIHNPLRPLLTIEPDPVMSHQITSRRSSQKFKDTPKN